MKKVQKVALAALVFVSCAGLLLAARTSPTSAWRSVRVAVTTTAATTILSTGGPCAGWRFYNSDAADRACINVNGGTAVCAGTNADFTNQVVLEPGASKELWVHQISGNTVSMDASTGTADVDVEATCYQGL